ncbi:bifunctional folylpolyglutamate synthase/dihydrofolate synthase [Heliorestis convoluta]|uniref:bifunctional folylpolyglutamate synthase/dihydrofolate synthase n=1 Tax=Heliorestis convoluta TaxID=356322 RepID=UPI001FAAEDD9|nr:folylpolyglutamate synthase/dihydrofolate synthase family protein [Heliorestis convoluta]
MHYLQDLTKFGINPGLGRIQELLHRLGQPQQRKKPQFIHIGGTNGKGSTAVIIAKVLEEAGYRVGLFTSPHLHCYTERTQINGTAILKDQVAHLIGLLKGPIESMVAEGYDHPTEFEVWTALSFLYFTREEVDIVVLEVGMGGAIDSTNVITPLLSVITNVTLDHMDYLGTTVEEIAQVKAGIIKEAVPVVTASEDPLVLTVIQERAKAKSAPVVQVVRHGPKMATAQWVQWDGVRDQKKVMVEGRLQSYGPLKVPLQGHHQQQNLATAIAALEVAKEQGYEWTEKQLSRALEKTTWPGRQEKIGKILLDGAHNEGGASSLARTLQEEYKGIKKILILALLADKAREKIVALLAPEVDEIIITQVNHTRAGDWKSVEEVASPYGKPLQMIACIQDALQAGQQAVEKYEDKGMKAIVVVTGSLYMIAEARKELTNHKDL